MPDLGKYSVEVLSAYGLTVLLLLAISTLTWVRSRKIRRDLEQAEARLKDG